MISEEQREGTADQRPWIGLLYNHSPWPFFEDISEEDEARFVDACRFVRITQADAGIPIDAQLPKAHERGDDLHTLFNRAAVLTAMRRAMAEGMTLREAGGYEETIPGVSCRVFVAGKISGFTGILPGLFEELLYCFEEKKPIFILGGFGGASARLAGYLSGELTAGEASLDLDKLIAAQVLRGCRIGGTSKKAGEVLHPADIPALGLLRELAQAHVLDHAKHPLMLLHKASPDCYNCHPGNGLTCYRGHHSLKPSPTGVGDLWCTDCHGDLNQRLAEGQLDNPWSDKTLPTCKPLGHLPDLVENRVPPLASLNSPWRSPTLPVKAPRS